MSNSATTNPTTPITLTVDNFQHEVLDSTVPVVVDFWAAWCGPCRMVSPIVEALAADFAGTAKVGKLNIDDYPKIASQYSIHAVPTLLIFQGGRPVTQVIGVASKQALADKLNAVIQSQNSTTEQAAA